jgi:hypothetical protein
MSFDVMRSTSIQGDHEKLREALVGVANTCQADEFGITPLMNAVWNGHIECVKYLVSNDMGVSAKGQKRSSLNMQTSSGYTALHLAGSDCREESVREITFLLLALGVDTTIKTDAGKTALEMATESENNGFIEVYHRFMSAADGEDDELNIEVDELRRQLAASYAFRSEATLFVKPFKANFPVPRFLFKKERLGGIPYGLTVHEAQIEPLIKTGYDKLRGANSLRCMQFAMGQAEINEARREKLLKTFQPDWERPDDGDHLTESIVYKKNKT